MGEKTAQGVVLGLGLLMTLVGGLVEARDVLRMPEVFMFVFFGGWDYILLFSGLTLVTLAMGYDRLFGPEDDSVEVSGRA